MSDPANIPAAVLQRFAYDPRVASVRWYATGWKWKSYTHANDGTWHQWTKQDDGTYTHTLGTYDRRRLTGKGPDLVMYNAKGSRLPK